MIRIKNKKGISEVISSVLIIVLTISSTLFVFGAMNNLLDNPALSPEYSCPNLKFKAPIEITSACYNSRSEEVEISLYRKKTDLEINKMNFIVSSSSKSNSEIYSCSQYAQNSCSGMECKVPTEESSEKYYLVFNSTDINGEKEISVSVNNCIIDVKSLSEC